MTEQDAPSIEQAQGDDVLNQLKGIHSRLQRLPLAPTEVVLFEINPGKTTETLKQAAHVKINVQTIMITADPVLAAAGVTFTFHLGNRAFPFHFDVITNNAAIPLPVKWDRGVDAWFEADTGMTEFHCYVLGTVE